MSSGVRGSRLSTCFVYTSLLWTTVLFRGPRIIKKQLITTKLWKQCSSCRILDILKCKYEINDSVNNSCTPINSEWHLKLQNHENTNCIYFAFIAQLTVLSLQFNKLPTCGQSEWDVLPRSSLLQVVMNVNTTRLENLHHRVSWPRSGVNHTSFTGRSFICNINDRLIKAKSVL